MGMNASKWLAMAVAVLVVHADDAHARPARAGTWTVEGTTKVSYSYEGRHVRLSQPFATRLVIHDDGSIDGEVIEPSCGPSGDTVTFAVPPSSAGRASIGAALR